MELARHKFYAFDLNEDACLISFVWTEKSAAMTVGDYKAAIREYARLALAHRARCALVDLRQFRCRIEDADALGSWWADDIVPLYNQAGLKKLAFVLPEGAQVPPQETPTAAETGEAFATGQFGSEQAAICWLTTRCGPDMQALSLPQKRSENP